MFILAVDESDFGTPIELGLDLFCNGNPELHGMAKQLLIMGYSLVQRPHFIAILKVSDLSETRELVKKVFIQLFKQFLFDGVLQ